MASTISHAQLIAQLAQGAVAPLYAIVGEEDLLRDMALGALKSALLGEDESDFNCDLFYGDDVSGSRDCHLCFGSGGICSSTSGGGESGR